MDILLHFGIMSGLAGAAAALYSVCLDGEFLLDDNLVVQNRYLQQYMRTRKTVFIGETLGQVFSYYGRPLIWWTYLRDASVWGMRPRGWHMTSIALHALAVALVYALLLRWVDLLPAVIGALGFLAHPLATAATGYIAGRPSLLCALFTLAAVLCVLVGVWPLALPAIALAAQAKEEWIAAPGLCLAAYFFGMAP